METFSHVPPGFRFHPTDEELVDYYLRKKITSRRIDLDVIKDVDLYKIEPWDLQEICRIGTEEQSDWYFFSHKDKKYPTGTRTNRATAAGFWKATGRDKSIYSKHELIGMRKTLVFYKGRAPNGQKSDWIMHEYRLETDENGTPQEEGWVVCRVFKKRLATTMRRVMSDESPIWYDEHVSFMPDMESPKQSSQSSLSGHSQYPYLCKKEMMIMNLQYQNMAPQNQFLQLPLLENPNIISNSSNSMPAFGLGSNITNGSHFSQPQEQISMHSIFDNNSNNEQDQVATDWRVLDKFVASQLMSQDDQVSNTTNNFTTASTSDDSSFMVKQLDKQDWE